MSPLVLFVCRTHTQHKVSSLNAGDTLNTQNEPEEMMKREKKSEALNIRGRIDFGGIGSPFQGRLWTALSSSSSVCL